MKILVIDDIVAIQEMISEYLTDLGHSVESRSDISEDDYKYDLLLCDLGSVRKFLISGGMCLLRGENPGLKVILISGSECMYSSEEYCYDTFLMKPFSFDKLVETISIIS